MTIKINRHFYLPFSPVDSKERKLTQRFKPGSIIKLAFWNTGEDERAPWTYDVEVEASEDSIYIKYLNDRYGRPADEPFISEVDGQFLESSGMCNDKFYYSGCINLKSWIFHEVSFDWEPTLPKQARK